MKYLEKEIDELKSERSEAQYDLFNIIGGMDNINDLKIRDFYKMKKCVSTIINADHFIDLLKGVVDGASKNEKIR